MTLYIESGGISNLREDFGYYGNMEPEMISCLKEDGLRALEQGYLGGVDSTCTSIIKSILAEFLKKENREYFSRSLNL